MTICSIDTADSIATYAEGPDYWEADNVPLLRSVASMQAPSKEATITSIMVVWV
jgi:hypothetical protein